MKDNGERRNDDDEDYYKRPRLWEGGRRRERKKTQKNGKVMEGSPKGLGWTRQSGARRRSSRAERDFPPPHSLLLLPPSLSIHKRWPGHGQPQHWSAFRPRLAQFHINTHSRWITWNSRHAAHKTIIHLFIFQELLRRLPSDKCEACHGMLIENSE